MSILLWLAERHGALAPSVGSSQRAGFLKWLFFASNTLHADLRMLFYPQTYIGPDPVQQRQLQQVQRQRLQEHLTNLETAAKDQLPWLGGDDPSVLDLYLACQLRWMALYPQACDRSWMTLQQYPHLYHLCAKLELRPSVLAACRAEGLGPTPFTSPILATPPEGSAT